MWLILVIGQKVNTHRESYYLFPGHLEWQLYKKYYQDVSINVKISDSQKQTQLAKAKRNVIHKNMQLFQGNLWSSSCVWLSDGWLTMSGNSPAQQRADSHVCLFMACHPAKEALFYCCFTQCELLTLKMNSHCINSIWSWFSLWDRSWMCQTECAEVWVCCFSWVFSFLSSISAKKFEKLVCFCKLSQNETIRCRQDFSVFICWCLTLEYNSSFSPTYFHLFHFASSQKHSLGPEDQLSAFISHLKNISVMKCSWSCIPTPTSPQSVEP